MNRTEIQSDINENVYTNTTKRIKGNTIRDRLRNIALYFINKESDVVTSISDTPSDDKIASEKAVKTYVDANAGGGGGGGGSVDWGSIGGVLGDQLDLKDALDSKFSISDIDTDTSLTTNSDSKVASQKATKAYAEAMRDSAKSYADGLVVGLWDDRGTHDASGGAYPTTGGSGSAGAIKKGDTWTISVAGTLPTSQVVEVGDVIRALVDTPGSTQSNWAIQQNNIGYTAENSANKTNSITGNETSTTLYASVKGLVDWLTGSKIRSILGISTLSGSNTGDETTTSLGSTINGATEKTTIADSDMFGLMDSAASNILKKLSWANFKSVLDSRYIAASQGTVLAETATNGATSSGTSNTYSTGVLITPDMISADTTIEVLVGMKKTGTAGTTTIRIYVNTTNDLSGSPILVGTFTTVAATLYVAMQRFLRIKVKNGGGAGTEVQNASAATAQNEYIASGSAVSTLVIDWTSNKYIIAAMQTANGGDAALATFLKVRR